jgi:hypothetical protein
MRRKAFPDKAIESYGILVNQQTILYMYQKLVGNSCQRSLDSATLWEKVSLSVKIRVGGFHGLVD